MRVTEQFKADVAGEVLLETLERTVVTGKELFCSEAVNTAYHWQNTLLTAFLKATSFARVTTRASKVALRS